MAKTRKVSGRKSRSMKKRSMKRHGRKGTRKMRGGIFGMNKTPQITPEQKDFLYKFINWFKVFDKKPFERTKRVGNDRNFCSNVAVDTFEIDDNQVPAVISLYKYYDQRIDAESNIYRGLKNRFTSTIAKKQGEVLPFLRSLRDKKTVSGSHCDMERLAKRFEYDMQK